MQYERSTQRLSFGARGRAGTGSNRGGGCLSLRLSIGHLSAVRFEFGRPREFSKLMSYHLLGDVHGSELLPIVYRKRETDEFRRDIAPARPCLDDLLLPCLDHPHNLLKEFRFNVGAFFEGAGHEI